ncbi:uncharacterized protein, partial [Nyctibius grandis]|uniref:uncharacterized protein n=1 Tax=Nyctibius grandis TaxID=48427 RepID=UPI0035BC946A
MGQDWGAVGQDGGAMGQEPLAMGQDGGAMGQEPLAMGQDGGAMGQEPFAMGQDGGAMGQEPLAMGQDVAMGQEPLPRGPRALAVGLAQEVANAGPTCPLLPHISRLLPHTSHRLLLCPHPPPGTRPPPRLTVWAGPRGRGLALSPSRRWALLGAESGGAQWVHVGTGQVVQEVPGQVGALRAVAALGEELVALGGAGGGLELRRRLDGARLWSVSAHSGPVTGLAPHPGGVISAGLDGRVQ